MLRHLKSAAARSPMRSPPPHPPSAPAPRDEGFEEEEEEEESARAIAVSDQRTIYLVRPAFTRPLTPSPISTVDLIWWCSTFGVNMFIANTVEFLNSFAAQCNDKLSLLHRKIVKLDSSLNLLEAKLRSIDDTNAFGHSTNQKAHGLFTQDGRFEPTNLLGESSR
ncbi:hypothetical protein OsJ_14206 [Oryza sativa Japonica Group]|nr:hypothetical protein OsJ_14206 [Oryza sativa Japonica Group]